MRRVMVVLAAAAALLLAAVPADAVEICQRRARRCSTPPSPRAKARSEATFAAVKRLSPGERIAVPVVYHVVYGSYGPQPGEAPDDLAHAPPVELIHRQAKVLKRAFRGTRFSFPTVEVAFHDFTPWSMGPRSPGVIASAEEVTAMLRDLSAGRRDVLHVLLLPQVTNRAAPADLKSLFENASDVDGILMNWEYLPYVPALRPIGDRTIRRWYYEGETLVHLVGHYAGLLDTFEEVPEDCYDTCAKTTDFVRDTPAHRWLYEENGPWCLPQDTCPGLPGLDPMTNFMSDEPDLCASEFTPGQVERMERMVRTFRPHFIVPASSHAH
jgi:hypothetical protein